MRLRRKRPASSVEPDRVEAAAEVLERWATRGSAQSMLYTYKREAKARRQRQTRADRNIHPAPRDQGILIQSSSTTAAPQPPASFSEPVPSRTGPPGGPTIPGPVPSAEFAEGPAAEMATVVAIAEIGTTVPVQNKSEEREDYEAFVAFETMRGNSHCIAERAEEARNWEPEPEPAPYLWDGGLS